MTRSATEPPEVSGRELRRERTVHRIVAEARRLTVDRGIDGWTMEDLAAATGVSRRTLFNHVAGKDDAVLGPLPELPADALDDFVAGGPHGGLLDDLVALAVRVIAGFAETPEEVALGRAVLDADPRLHRLSTHRLLELVEQSIDLVEQREGAAYDRDRFDLTLALLLACVEVAMSRYLTGEHGDDLGALLVDTVHTARTVLA